MSWYRIYRPQTISGLHITSVRETLSKMLEGGNLPHALLFAGPKGTGKTSSARIIAKVLNCDKNAKRKSGAAFVEPCNECEMCLEITQGSALNVVEMDGASNRRIDDIRQLKEQIYMPPAQGSKLVYIIDEVHMLTKEAFNALLKILEEPPEHAVFIFATTDPQKIPDTILSRTTLVKFTKATVEELATSLEQIAKVEKIQTDSESLDLIAQSADGSFRDAVKLFEQLANQAKVEKIEVNKEWVSQQLSTMSQDGVKKLLQSILAKDERAIIEFFQTARDQQIDAHVVHKQILAFLHQELVSTFINKSEPFTRKEILLFLLKQFSAIEIPLTHPFPLLPLELCAVEMVLRSKEKGKTSGNSDANVTGSKEISQAKKIEIVIEKKAAEPEFSISGSNQNDAIEPSSISQIDGTLIGEQWQQLLKTIGRHNLSLEAILRSAQFVAGEHGKATIKVFYGFHKEQLELQRYRSIVEQAIQELLGGHVRCEYILSSPDKADLREQNDNIRGAVDKEFVNVIEEALL